MTTRKLINRVKRILSEKNIDVIKIEQKNYEALPSILINLNYCL